MARSRRHVLLLSFAILPAFWPIHTPQGSTVADLRSSETDRGMLISHGTEAASAAHITMPSVLTDLDLQPSSVASMDGSRDIFLLYSETVDGVP